MAMPQPWAPLLDQPGPTNRPNTRQHRVSPIPRPRFVPGPGLQIRSPHISKTAHSLFPARSLLTCRWLVIHLGRGPTMRQKAGPTPPTSYTTQTDTCTCTHALTRRWTGYTHTYINLRLTVPALAPLRPLLARASPRGPAMPRNTPHPTTAPTSHTCRPLHRPALPVSKGSASMALHLLPSPSSCLEHRPPMKQEQSLVGRISFWLRADILASRSRLASALLLGRLCLVSSCLKT